MFKEGVIAAGSTATGEIGNVLTGTMREFSINQPKWPVSVGNMSENTIPTGYDVYKALTGDN